MRQPLLAIAVTGLLLAPPAASQRPILRSSESTPGTEHGAAVCGPGDLDGVGDDDLLIGRPGVGEVLVLNDTASPTTIGPFGRRYGAALAGVGDVDGDARPDWAVGAPGAPGGGTVELRSGATSALIRTVGGAGAPGDELGASLACVGDVDGDQVGDLLAGAPQTWTGPGYAVLYSGATGDVITTYASAFTGDRLGAAVAGVGDVDGDLVPDVAIGSPGSDTNGLDAGSVYVASGASGALLFTFHGDAAGDELGFSLADAGDVDLDARRDLIAGAPRAASGGTGYARIWSLAGAGAVIRTHTGTGWFGAAVAGVGDYDCDGYADVAVGAPAFSSHLGAAYVFSGSDGARLVRTGGFYNAGGWPTPPGSGLGAAVSAAGDFDGDGRPDVAVGGPEESHFLFDLHGHVFVFTASEELASSPSPDPGEGYGRSVRFVGDVDGDGRDDLAVSSPVRIVSGASGATIRDLPGSGAVGRAGDVSGDGVPDVIVAGSPTVVYSGADGSVVHTLPAWDAVEGGKDVDGDFVPDLVASDGAGATVYSGATGAVLHTFAPLGGSFPPQSDFKNVALIDDLTGDGRAEILVADPTYIDPQFFSLGIVRLFSSSGALLHTFPNLGLVGEFGIAVCDAGDFDGDGLHDVAIGSEDLSVTISTMGFVHVYSGADYSLLYDSDVRKVSNWGIRPARSFGFEVRGAGDLDGNGFDDILIASPYMYGFGFNAWAAGRVEVIGGPSGASIQSRGALDGYDAFGYSVDGGGDADGDGRPDWAVGVPIDPQNSDGSVNSSARVQVFAGPKALSEVRSFCVRTPNSRWERGASIRNVGSTSIAVDDFALEASFAPVGVFGLFFMGPNAIQLPFGNGFRCVGGPIRRLGPPLTTSSPFGYAGRSVDFTTSPANQIAPGSTWRFQFYFRDFAGGGAGIDLSDGLEVTFRP